MTTSNVGFKNGHIWKNLTQNGEPQDVAGNAEEEEVMDKIKRKEGGVCQLDVMLHSSVGIYRSRSGICRLHETQSTLPLQ